jgi:hypothetical protein
LARSKIAFCFWVKALMSFSTSWGPRTANPDGRYLLNLVRTVSLGTSTSDRSDRSMTP